MKKIQKDLLAISTKISSLAQLVEKIAETIEQESGKAAPAKKAAAKKKAKASVKKAKAPAKKKAAPKKRAAKKAAVKKTAATAPKDNAPVTAGGETMLEGILGMISRSRKGITVERLKKRTGLEARQVSNALYKLTKKGKIETLSRGLYIKKKK